MGHIPQRDFASEQSKNKRPAAVWDFGMKSDELPFAPPGPEPACTEPVKRTIAPGCEGRRKDLEAKLSVPIGSQPYARPNPRAFESTGLKHGN